MFPINTKIQNAQNLPLRSKSTQRLKGALLVSCALAITSCTSTDLLETDNQRINDLRIGSSSIVTINPRDGDLHMANGYGFLQQAKNSPSDLYFARSAFERAAVLKVDDPIPHFLTGYSFFALGQYEDATRAFVSAAFLDQTADGWWLASLSALRAGNEIAAQTLYDQGKIAETGRSNKLQKFMQSMYGSAQQSSDVVVRSELTPITQFKCGLEYANIEDAERICASDLEIEFFIVEREIFAGSIVGQDLLSDLSLDIDGSRRVNESRTSSSSSNLVSFSQSLSLDLASLSYDLSLASNGEVSDTVTATPKLRVRLSQPSIMTSGKQVTIVAAGTSGPDLARGVQTRSGITINTSLSYFDGIGAQILASVEVSDTSNLEVNSGFAKLSNNSSKIDTAKEVKYNTAFVLGSLDYREEILRGNGQIGLRSLPALGVLFGQTESLNLTKEVVILGILRPPAEIGTNEEAQFLFQIGERGVATARRARRQPIVHTMPSMREFIVEMGLLD